MNRKLSVMLSLIFLAGFCLGGEGVESLDEYFFRSIGLKSVEEEQSELGAAVTYRMVIFANRRMEEPFSLTVGVMENEDASSFSGGKAVARWVEDGRLFRAEKLLSKGRMEELLSLFSDEEIFYLSEQAPLRDDGKSGPLLSQGTLLLERIMMGKKIRIFRALEGAGPALRIKKFLVPLFDSVKKSAQDKEAGEEN